MLSNLTSFIKSNVAPNITASANTVDVYGNFSVTFKACENSSEDKDFSNSEIIPKYNNILKFFDRDLHNFIKNINDMELNVNADQLKLPGVSYGINRLMPMNSNNTLTMLWLNTKIPFIETIIVPWMQDNTIKNHFPIIKCDLVITFPKLALDYQNLEYHYYGIRPVECTLHKMTNEALTDFYRKVTFDFDYFFINHETFPGMSNENTSNSNLFKAQMDRDEEIKKQLDALENNQSNKK